MGDCLSNVIAFGYQVTSGKAGQWQPRHTTTTRTRPNWRATRRPGNSAASPA